MNIFSSTILQFDFSWIIPTSLVLHVKKYDIYSTSAKSNYVVVQNYKLTWLLL